MDSERQIALQLVIADGMALGGLATVFQSDHAIVLAAVERDGLALQHAANELRSDHQIVMKAVSEDGNALQFAANALRNDTEIVLAAVAQDGSALEHAAEELRCDRSFALSAAALDSSALEFVSPHLLDDPRFAVKAREEVCLFRVTTMSGRACYVSWPALVTGMKGRSTVLQDTCRKLGMSHTGFENLLFGDEFVPDDSVKDWPGAPAPGKTVEYQLVTLMPEHYDSWWKN
mmetsp:Transcript_38211/g.85972  ORF Transcript_38211/g.85972 Transcript_38211/m.85972 type:complete len:232 (+) Transcript_38211:1-696(+)